MSLICSDDKQSLCILKNKNIPFNIIQLHFNIQLIVATCIKSYLVEDVWYVLLRAGFFSVAQLRSIFAGQ